MALDLKSDEKALGEENFRRATGELSRRGFMKGLVAGTAVVPVAAAAYYGYNFEKVRDRPVRAALIGAGDEGGVLIGEHNPNYLEFVAYSDIRPYNQKRIFKGEPTGPRRGFNYHYGNECVNDIKLFENYHELLDDKKLGIEAVVIALPLHLHAAVAIEAMRKGKHVLCEKLMAWNIDQCKKMIQVAEETNRILTIGHQRHYSLLYAQAVEAIQAGVLGDIRHIRALWHRNNTWPRLDKNGKPIIVPEHGHQLTQLRDSWHPEIRKEDREALEKVVTDKYDFKSMEELVRWRLYNRTGGGLMAELGSHQLDACSIFLGKVHPLAVSGYGGKLFYTDDREVEDHVFVTFEFPGHDYYVRDNNGKPTREVKNRNDIVVVMYSSINTNQFEGYGECVMGTRGTMIVEAEQKVMLYGEKDPNLRESGAPRATAVTVTEAGKKPVLDASASTGGAGEGVPLAAGPTSAAGAGPVSRGYREEMEHFAYCVRMHGEAEKAKDAKEQEHWRLAPRCHGRVAMADAIIALTSNQAMKRHERIEFKEEWFDPKASAVPDADMKALNAKNEPITL
jgi:predicted dehydrogenase